MVKGRGVKKAPRRRRTSEEDITLARRILQIANRGAPRMEFTRDVADALLEGSGADAVELWLSQGERYFRLELGGRHARKARYEMLSCRRGPGGRFMPCPGDAAGLGALCHDVLEGRVDPARPWFTRNGSFWTGDAKAPHVWHSDDGEEHVLDLALGGADASIALVPFVIDDENTGVLLLRSRHRFFFTREDVAFYESVAQTVGIAVTARRAQAALRERIKELTCLYSVSHLAQRPDVPIAEILQGFVEMIPAAWQYPENAHGRIVFDGAAYKSRGFREGRQRQTAAIGAGEHARGLIEVHYAVDMPEVDDEGPFLLEERQLIDGLAREVALIVERRRVDEDRERLQEQLRHADRLATIGQLAAGVAHELNEPLGGVLGFAQLALKTPGLPAQAGEDMKKIVNAALHAREVIKKLLFFARQTPPRTMRVNLNEVVDEALYFLNTRCAKEGIEIVRDLASRMPAITADRSQLNQVLVNLAVNAVQAMAGGGRLTVTTRARDDAVFLAVEDTGMGMNADVLRQIFIPFYTTKDVGQGTGLGLPVVHGIVKAHCGEIKIESAPGRGTRFEVILPISGPKE